MDRLRKFCHGGNIELYLDKFYKGIFVGSWDGKSFT